MFYFTKMADKVAKCVLYTLNKYDETMETLTQKYIQEERKRCVKPGRQGKRGVGWQ